MNVDKLAGIVGAANCLTQEEDLLTYGYDGTAGLFEMAAAVVFPENTEQVQEIMRWANNERVPIVPRGSGAGLSGGSIPVKDGVVMCLVKLDQILEIDERNLTLRTQPGVITADITAAAGEAGLFYPPDPGSYKVSTIGGNVAENAGGLRGLKYGVTRDYVMGLEVVLPSGELLGTGNKCVKDVSGYSLKDLFVGSEGTLGIVTEILLKLIPPPAAKKTMLASYDQVAAAAETVSAIIAGKIIPCTLEFLDRVTIKCVEDFAKIGLPTDAEALLLMETDGHPAAVEAEAAAMRQIALDHGAREVTTAGDEQEAERLAEARRTAFSALARIKPTTILEDISVPRDRLVEMLAFIQEAGARHNVGIGTFGHMGDGNLHPTFITDESDTEEMARVKEATREVFEHAVKLGGTITGEHGVGLGKKPYFRDAVGDATIDVLRTVKQALDPNWVLNPGKIFDPPAAP